MDKNSFYNTYKYLAYATPFGVEMQAPEYGIIDGAKRNDKTHYHKLLLKVAYTNAHVVLTSEEALKVYEFERSGHYTENETFTDESLDYFLKLFFKYVDLLYDQYKVEKGEDGIPEDVQEYINKRKEAEENLNR